MLLAVIFFVIFCLAYIICYQLSKRFRRPRRESAANYEEDKKPLQIINSRTTIVSDANQLNFDGNLQLIRNE